MKAISRIALLIGLLLSLAWIARAEVETEIPDFYGKAELATRRSLLRENIEGTQNPAIMAKTTETLLRGPLTVSVRVVDAKTSQPLNNYVLHAFYVARGRRLVSQEHHDNVSGVKWAYRMDHELPIGRMESKVVAAADGHCVYDNMPAGGYWFQVLADGYVPIQESVAIDANHLEVVIGVQPTLGLRLRLVDELTSRPLAGVLVKLHYPPEHEQQQVSLKGYEGRTDGNGGVFFGGLPQDRYRIDITSVNLPELQHYYWTGSDKMLPEIQASLSMRPGMTSDLAEPVGAAEFRAFEKLLQQPLYIVPELSADLSKGAADLGTITLRRVPLMDVAINDGHSSTTLPFFPFEMEFVGKSRHERRIFRYATDGTGHARLPLVGFFPGMKVVMAAPGELYGRYQIKEIVADSAKPVHPNLLVGEPKAGETLSMLLAYKPTEHDVDLHLSFRDKATGKPILKAYGALAQFDPDMENIQRGRFFSTNSDGVRRFETADGKALVRHYTIGESLSRLEKDVAEKDRKDPNGRKDDYDHKHLRILLYVRASGYMPQAFEIPLTDARSQRELTFDLEPGTVVRGRVMIAAGAPFTSDTLKSILVKQGHWDEKAQKALTMTFGGGGRKPMVRFSNQIVEGQIDITGPAHFAKFVMVPIKPDGTFATSELRAAKHWDMIIETGFLPTYTQRGLEIKLGDNDLGEIVIGGGGGTLNFRLADEHNQPIAGARLDFPLENGSYRGTLRNKLLTDASGQVRLDLNFLESGPRQVLHLSPPWGFDKDPREDFDAHSRIVYDRLTKLDKNARADLATTLTRGHTLTVRVSPGETGRKLVEHYADPRYWPLERDRRNKTRNYIAVRGFALEGLGSPTDAFRYHQYGEVAGGLSLTSGTQELEIKDVPPGPLSLRVDGGFYAPLAGQKSPTEARDGVPIAYTELVMPPSDHTVAVELNPAEVAVDLEGVTPERVAQGKLEFNVIMEREKPLSTVLGSDMRRIIAAVASQSGKDPESIQTPLVGYADGFVCYGKDGNYQYRPACFLAVPPGKYTIKAYRGLMAMMGPAPKTCWEQQVEIKPGGGKTTLKMPYPANAN